MNLKALSKISTMGRCYDWIAPKAIRKRTPSLVSFERNLLMFLILAPLLLVLVPLQKLFIKFKSLRWKCPLQIEMTLPSL